MSRSWSRREIFALTALMTLILGLRIYWLPHYPYHEDEAGTIIVMRSIVSHGLPLTDNGLLYWRSLLGNYLMALPLFFAGISPYSTRLVCVLCSVLLLPVVYTMGKRTGAPLAGWLAVLFLAFSSYENLFASMARFYLPFQLFFTIAVYLAGEFFIARRPQSGTWLLAATLAAIGTHRFALGLFPVFSLALWAGRSWDLLRSRRFWASAVVVALALFVNFFWTPAGSFVNYTAIPLKIGGLEKKLVFLEWFEKFAPFGASLFLVGLVPFWHERRGRLGFYAVSFALSLLLLSLGAPADNPRYFSYLFPLGVLCVAASLCWWLKTAWTWVRQGAWPLRYQWPGVALVLILGLGYAGGWEVHTPASAFGHGFTYIDQGAAHRYMEQHWCAGDLLISTEPVFSEIYLHRRADYFLREKYDDANGRYAPYSAREKDRLSVPIIDSPEKLRAVLAQTDHRIWLYANWKITFTVSPEMDMLIRRQFRPVFTKGETYVLVRP